MTFNVFVKAKNKEFEEEYLKLILEANIQIGDYGFFYSEYLDKLNKIYTDLDIRYNEDSQKFYFEMPFEIPYEELMNGDYNEVCQNEMHNFIDLIKPILKIFSDKENFTKIFDDYKKPDAIQPEITIDD